MQALLKFLEKMTDNQACQRRCGGVRLPIGEADKLMPVPKPETLH